MKLALKLLTTGLFASIIILAFNLFFMDLLERPYKDQIFLMALPAVALWYLFYIFFYKRVGNFDYSTRNTVWGKRNINTSIMLFVRGNIFGILLALFFFAIYTYIGLRINVPNVDLSDNFFDADTYGWNLRISAPIGSEIEMRGPHPFTYFILRPLGWGMNFLTNNNYWLSSILVNTFVGGLSVFMVWLIIKRQFQNSVYAFLIASLLGLSTSHLFFGSAVESYIFSAASLIGFVFVLQSNKSPSLVSLAAASLLTFGITLTNFAQNFIGYIVDRSSRLESRSWKTLKVFFVEIILFAGLTISIGILISLIHAAWYPSSQLFFLPSSAAAEGEFAFDMLQEPFWKISGRIVLLIRVILFYSIVAPQPYALLQELNCGFPCFYFFKITPGTYNFSSYHNLAQILVLAWLLLLILSTAMFFLKIIRSRKIDFALAFALSIVFNFILHFIYGFEVFLYSPDWVYALILFVAFTLSPLAKNHIFQGVLMVFLLVLAYNQFQFIQFVFKTIAPFIP